MSYKYTVISDNPIAFYQMTDSPPVETYQDVLDRFDTYQQLEDAYSIYEQLTGKIVYDSSGCRNNGIYEGELVQGLMPLVSGGVQGIPVNNINYMSFPITRDYCGLS